MHKVGINGGGLLVEIGDASAMSVFFDLVTEHAFQLDEPAIALVCDRLYRRYVRGEDAEATLEALRSIRDVFSSVPATTLEERIANEKKAGSGILFTETNLAGAFSKYFSAIDRCIESAEYAFQYFEEGRKLEYSYEPVMVIRSELPASCWINESHFLPMMSWAEILSGSSREKTDHVAGKAEGHVRLPCLSDLGR